MESVEKKSPLTAGRRLLSTRRGAVAAALAATAISGAALLAFLQQYRETVDTGALPTQVLVADRMIPKGSSGDAATEERMLRPSTVTRDQVRPTAVSDAKMVAGAVATRDILPGEQILTTDFARRADPLRGRLTGTQRAVGVSVDSAHGLLGNIRPGDKVDVLAGFNLTNSTGRGRPTVRIMLRDILVLEAPKKEAEGGGMTGSNKTATVVLRIDDVQAGQLAYAADNGKLWVALRPPAGAKDSELPPAVDLASLMVQSKPLSADATSTSQPQP